MPGQEEKERRAYQIASDQTARRATCVEGGGMAEREPCEHAKRFMKRPAYYGVLGYLARQKAKRNKIDTGEEIGRGQRMLEKVSEESEGITEP